MKSIKQYIHELLFLLGRDKSKLPIIILLFIISSLIDIVSLGLIFPFFLLIMGREISDSAYFSDLIDTLGVSMQDNDLIVIVCILLIIVFLLKSIVGLYIERIIMTFGQKQRAKLKEQLMWIYQHLKLDDFHKYNSSHYINMILKITDNYGSAIQAILQLISNSIVGIAILFFLIWQSPLVLLLSLGVLGLTAITFDTLFKKRIKVFGQKMTKQTANIIRGVNEGLNGFKDIRILGKELYFHKIVKENSKENALIQGKYQTLIKAPRYLNELAIVISIMLFVLLAIQYDYSLQLLLPTLAIFIVAAIRLIPIVSYFSVGINNLRLDRYPVSLLYNELHSFRNNTENQEIESIGSMEPFKSISLNAVNFYFPNIKKQVLSNISISIHRGETVGIIGASGAGKTTLIDIILGFHKPKSGSIFYNESPLHNVLPLWYSHVAYLPQQTFLIDSTLRHNIALGIDDNDVDYENLYAAIEKAQLGELVDQLPNGVDTWIGEKGAKLSGGQGQRVAIARAFYHNRDVFVMDEVTNALDQETEDKIAKEIYSLKGKITLIMIMHRLNKNIHFDSVYRLVDGTLILQPKE